MKNKKIDVQSTMLIVTGLSLFTGIIAVIFFFFLTSQEGVTPAPPSRAEPTISLSPTTAQNNIKTYTNTIYHFSFNYPSELKLRQELPSQFVHKTIISFEQTGYKGIILEVDDTDLDSILIHLTPIKTVTFNGITWQLYRGKYCEGTAENIPGCTDIIQGYSLLKNGVRFSLNLGNLTPDAPLVTTILSSFRFLD